jgi:hypothetical protein
LFRYHEESSILQQKPEKPPKPSASFGVKRTIKTCPWLFLVAIITIETFLHEAASRHPKAQLRERTAGPAICATRIACKSELRR